MTVRPLIYAPHPTLTQKTQRVKHIDASIHRLIRDMIETMHVENGVGLAANQIGVPLRVAVIQLPEDEEPTVLINPEVLLREGEREEDEGCLSIPGYTGRVKRSERVHVKALGADGESFRIKAEGGLLAEVLEHETDHLNGILYIERLVSREQLYKIDYKRDESSEASYMAEMPDIRE